MSSRPGSSDRDAHVAAYTPEQAVAVEHVCLLAEECAHPRFGHVTPLGTVVLTINAGYE